MVNHDVELLEVRPFESNTLEAFIDIRIDFFVVYGAKIMKRESGEKWLAWPSIEKDGKYYDTVGIDSRSLEKEIKGEILQQYKQKTGVTDDIFGNVNPVPTFGHPDGEGLFK